MAGPRFAVLALLVAMVAFTAVHAKGGSDDSADQSDDLCWGCAAGSCINVTSSNTGRKLLSRKLFKKGGDDGGEEDGGDDDNGRNKTSGSRTVCTMCVEGYALKNETENGVVIGGECKCDYANGYGKWENKTLEACVKCADGFVPLTCLSGLKGVYNKSTKAWELVLGKASSCTKRSSSEYNVEDWKAEKKPKGMKRVKSEKFKEKYCVKCPEGSTAQSGTCIAA